ncbi:putative six-bladed beta-propeller, TolB [Helianthus anomalus]
MLNYKLFLIIYLLLSVGPPSNNRSADDDVEVIPITNGAFGPESFDLNPVDGSGPYTGVSDGQIVKLVQSEGHWTEFAVTSKNR